MNVIACQFCIHWTPVRDRNANWGTCTKIIDLKELQADARAYYSVTTNRVEQKFERTNVSFHTINSFYCQLFERRQVKNEPTIVDIAREAARKLAERKTS